MLTLQRKSSLYATQILRYEHALEKAGVPQAQAAVHASNLAEVIDSVMVTREDLKSLENSVMREFEKNTHELKIVTHKIVSLEQKIEGQEDRFNTKLNAINDRVTTEIKACASQIESVKTELRGLIGLTSVATFYVFIYPIIKHYFNL